MTLQSLRPITSTTRVAVLALGAFALLASNAAAATVDLVAAPFTKTVTLPTGSVTVPMWGFGLGTTCAGAAPTVPGPRITVLPTDTTLTINLRNCLPEPVSIVIPGQRAHAADLTADAPGAIKSIARATAPTATSSYVWSDLKPGTYLYHSGSHAAVQVQMGLYGAVTRDADTLVAYSAVPPSYPAVPYANEALLLYSEIDTALHQAVAAGTYGTTPTSTIDYAPSLFLVNGESYTSAAAAIPAGAAGQRTLVRMLNAGLMNHAVVVDNASLSLVAEDGNPYRDARTQASILLPAGKTHDAIWMPTAAGEYSVYDRALRLVANEQASAGMLAKLTVTGTPVTPPPPTPSTITTAPDSILVAEDSPATLHGSVLTNDTGPALTAELYASPSAGALLFAFDNSTGTFTYQPPPNFSGVDSFSYRAVSGTDRSAPVPVTITVTPMPDAPTALPLTLDVDAGATKPITLTGIDPEGDPLTFTLATLPAAGTLSIAVATPVPGGALTYTAPIVAVPSTFTFTFQANDGVADSAAASVAMTVHPVATAALTPITLSVVGSDGANVTAYYWTLQEDLTFDPQPGVLDPNPLSVNFHRSSMPAVALGDETAPPSVDPTKRYFVSVLPKGPGFSNYTNSGGAIKVGQTSVQVVVNKTPLPTGQLKVQVFLDNGSLNGVLNNVEPGLEGFAVSLEDTAGTAQFAHQAAHQITDFNGNPLGTTYRACTDPLGCTDYEVNQYGKGYLLTDKDGFVTFKNLSPGLYEVFATPPSDQNYTQGIATIEGGLPIEAWVKPNEPAYFHEFGPPGPHITIGFVQKTKNTKFLCTGGLPNCFNSGPVSTITGTITSLHMSRVPAFPFFSGAPLDFTRPIVALQVGAGEYGQVVWLQETDEDGNFAIENVPGGVYKIIIFDSAGALIAGRKRVNVTAGVDVNLGDVPVFQWHVRQYHFVFDDVNQDGFRQATERGIPEQAINLRFRDGSIYQSFPTDVNGFVPFEQIFPFFNWLIAEVDYTRFKATGVTVVVDDGGDTSDTSANSGWPALVNADLDSRVLHPQPQSENGGAPYRTETGPVLLEGFQGFLGQTNVMLWGKTAYAAPGSVPPDTNVAPFDDFPVGGDIDGNANGKFDVDVYTGGVAGIVQYSTTRAENLARWGTPENWEPGVAGVTVQLWNADKTKLLNEASTDSWDESQPTGCQWPGVAPDIPSFTYLGTPRDCFDGLRNFNQVRPGVFDGGWAFYTQKSAMVNNVETFDLPMDQRTIEKPLLPGKYVVKLIVPPGYKIVKEEDKNVDFGNEYIPTQFVLTGYPLGSGGPSDPAARPRLDNDNLATPFCVGALHTVPAELSLFPGVPTTYAGDQIPLCDEKLVTLRNGQNAASPYFFLFTEAPIAAQALGFILDDTANEFDSNSPQFGEKYAPPWVPVSIMDYTGREIVRTYSDRNGAYNALVPSTFDARIPAPSGYSPNILQVCINPTMKPGPGGTQVPDEWHNKSYSQWCFPFQYMPGKTNYMDTPVVPTGAFAGQPGMTTVDAELPNLTPVIKSVTGPGVSGPPANGIIPLGPYVVPGGGTANVSRRITITSAGPVLVPNPEFDMVDTSKPKHITRDYGFGTLTGQVFVGTGLLTIPPGGWTDTAITALVPAGTQTGQLRVVRCLATPCGAAANRRESVLGVMLTVATPLFHAARPPKTVAAGGSIQAVIDAPTTLPGDLILVAPGTYRELVVMHKPVRLQGWGARSTIIDAVKAPTEKLQAWRDRVRPMLEANQPVPTEIIRCLPDGTPDPNAGCPDSAANPAFDVTFDLDTAGLTVGSYMLAHQADEYAAMVQTQNAPERADGEADPNETPKLGDAVGDLPIELLAVLLGGEGAGVSVLGQYRPVNVAGTPVACPVGNRADGGYGRQSESGNSRPNARVDGFTISGSDGAAGIDVNGNACDIELSNNHLFNNNGYSGAGIKVGHVGVLASWADDPTNNERVAIRYNLVSQNGSVVSFPGKDYSGGGGITIGGGTHGYQVIGNYVAGNFTGGYGAGIAHIGLSNNGTIDHNTVVFNESFNQMVARAGGGIYVGGRPAADGESFLSPVNDPRVPINYPPNLPGPTPGSGHVTISNNLIQGNSSASGDGGGVALADVNGRDVYNPRYQPETPGGENLLIDDALKVFVWDSVEGIITNGAAPWRVNVFGNTIVNNVAGLAGGGVSLRDAAYVSMVHNTIAHNDSLAVAGDAFLANPVPAGTTSDPFVSTPHPAGIASYQHSLNLAAGNPAGPSFSSPTIVSSIVWDNRTFHFGPVAGGVVPPQGPAPAPAYGLINAPASTPGTTPCSAAAPAPTRCWDLGVVYGGGSLTPTYSVLTAGASGTNLSTPPAFVSTAPYFNTNRRHSFAFSEVLTGTQPAPPLAPVAADEGGNYIRPMFGPLTLTIPATGMPFGDYHLTAGLLGQWLTGPGGLYPNLPAVPLSLALDRDGAPRLPRPSVDPHRGSDQASSTLPAPPPVLITITDARDTEGDAGLVAFDFTVSLSRAMPTALSLNFATDNGSATAGVDFVGQTGTLTFPPGTTEQTVRVMVNGDLLHEQGETFFVRLKAPGNSRLLRSYAVGEIRNDDAREARSARR